MKRFVTSTFVALALMIAGVLLAGCGSGGGSGSGGAPSQITSAGVPPAAQPGLNGQSLPAPGSVAGTPDVTGATAATAAPVSKQLALAWNPVAGATSYNLYWSTVPGVTPASGMKISVAGSSYVHTGLAAGTTYYYVVTAVDSSSESSASTQASGATSL